MATHELKTWPEYYEPVAAGQKRVELRLDDRGFATDDTLLLREYEPATRAYSGRELRARVTHIVRGGAWLTPGYVAMSIELLAPLGTCTRCGRPLDAAHRIVAGGAAVCATCGKGEDER